MSRRPIDLYDDRALSYWYSQANKKPSLNQYYDEMDYWDGIASLNLNPRLGMNNIPLQTPLPRTWNKLGNLMAEPPMNTISKEASAWGSALPALLLKYGVPGLLTGGLVYGGYKAYDWWKNRQQPPAYSVYDFYRDNQQYFTQPLWHRLNNINYYENTPPPHPRLNYVNYVKNQKPKVQLDAGINVTPQELSNDGEDTIPTNLTLNPADAETKAKIRRLARLY